MKLDKMRNEIIGKIDDSSYDPDTVLGFMNKALSNCTGVVDIPEFKRLLTVSTIVGQEYLYLNDQINSFGGRVRRVKYDGSDLKIYSSLEDMMDSYDDITESGDIESAALEGRILWYTKVPESSVDLLILCYINPEPLSKDNDELEWMPDHVQQKVIVSGACSYAFNEIEEEDSNKPVTVNYENDYESGINDFRAWIAKNRQSMSYSTWSV